MALAQGTLRCQTPVAGPTHKIFSAPSFGTRGVNTRVVASPLLKHSRARRAQQSVRAAAATEGQIDLVLPADEALQTLKITQRNDGMFIIEDVIEGSTAANV